MSSSQSPNMGLIIPTVGSEAGPLYAQDVNQSLSTLDGHNHTPGSGVAITPGAININSDLSFNSHKVTNAAALSLVSQTSDVTVAGSLYSKLGSETVQLNDLFYFDGTNSVQLTAGGQVNATIASLPGESYSAGVFTWRQGAGSITPANFDFGSITIRPNTAGTALGVTVAPSPSLASAFTLLLPAALPTSASLLQLDSTGQISSLTLPLGSSSIGSNAVGTAQLAANSVTPAKLSAINYVASASTNASASYAFPGADQTLITAPALTTSGRPVMLRLESGTITVSGYTAATSHFNLVIANSSGTVVYNSTFAAYYFDTIATNSLYVAVPDQNSGSYVNYPVQGTASAINRSFTLPASVLSGIAFLAAGTYTASLTASVPANNAGTLSVSGVTLIAYEG